MPGLLSNADPDAPKFVKTSGGTLIQEIFPGDDSGRPVDRGDTVLVDFVVRRANGYFIYSTVEAVSFQPSDVPTGPVLWEMKDNKLLPGLVEGLVGMRRGGKRRFLIPPEAGYLAAPPGAQPLMPTFGTSRQLQNHKKEPLIFEVQLRRIT
jgi:FKBP-type peptidyl-prolyl cis-trans isomerase